MIWNALHRPQLWTFGPQLMVPCGEVGEPSGCGAGLVKGSSRVDLGDYTQLPFLSLPLLPDLPWPEGLPRLEIREPSTILSLQWWADTLWNREPNKPFLPHVCQAVQSQGHQVPNTQSWHQPSMLTTYVNVAFIRIPTLPYSICSDVWVKVKKNSIKGTSSASRHFPSRGKSCLLWPFFMILSSPLFLSHPTISTGTFSLAAMNNGPDFIHLEVYSWSSLTAGYKQ